MPGQDRRTQGSTAPERPGAGGEKPQSRMLFNDISRFMGKHALLSVYGGEQVSGRILGHDEVANCILETDQKRRVLVLGKSIVAITDTGYEQH